MSTATAIPNRKQTVTAVKQTVPANKKGQTTLWEYMSVKMYYNHVS